MNEDNVKALISERIAEERKAIVKHQNESFGDEFSDGLDGGFTSSLLETLNLVDQASSLDEVKFAVLNFIVAVKNNVINLHDFIRQHADRLDNIEDRQREKDFDDVKEEE